MQTISFTTVSPTGTLSAKEKINPDNVRVFDWQVITNWTVSQCDTHTRALLVLYVKHTYGLKLSFNTKQFILSRRAKKAQGGNGEKLIISRDIRVGASIWYAEETAKLNKLGMYGKK